MFWLPGLVVCIFALALALVISRLDALAARDLAARWEALAESRSVTRGGGYGRAEW